MKKLRYILSLLLITLSVVQLLGQSVQRGVVVEYRDKAAKTPLARVAIAANNAGSTMSDEKGEFTLNFRTLKAGDNIQFRRIERSGYEVMNREAVEVMRIGSKANDKPLQIILCTTQLLNQLRDGYRSVTVQRYEKQLLETEAEIKRLKDEGKMKEDEYNQKMEELEAEYEEKLANIETYIDRFARIDMTALTEAENRTIQLVQQGKFEEAIANYESQDLVTLLNEIRKEREQLALARETLEEAMASKEEENKKLRQSISRQIDLLHLAGGEENMKKIHKILHDVYMADTTDVEARKNYAFSLFHHGERENACQLLINGYSCCTDLFEKAMIAVEIAARSNYVDAERMLRYAEMSDSISAMIDKSNESVSSRQMPASCYLQLLYYTNNENLERCAPLVKRAEQAWLPNVMDMRSLYDYITLAYTLAEYYSKTNNHERSVWAAEEAVRLDEIIFKTTPWHSLFVSSCATACDILSLEGKWDSATKYAQRFMSVATDYMKMKHTQNAKEFICDNAFKIYWALMDMGNTTLADSIDHFCQPIYAELSKNAQERVVGQYALYLMAKSSLTDTPTQAETLIDQAVAILTEYQDEETAYLTATPFRAKAFMKQGRHNEAVAIMTESIEKAKQAYSEYSSAWNADTYCCHCIALADIYGELGDKKQCKKWLKQARKFAAFESNNMKINKIKTKHGL